MEKFSKSLLSRGARSLNVTKSVTLINIQQRHISKEALKQIPYKFGNTKELLYKQEKTNAEGLHAFNELLTLPEYRLIDGFSVAYLAYLKSIQERNLIQLNSFCEKNLAISVSEGFEEINSEIANIELLNEKDFPKNVSMRVVDFNQTFGVSIDREDNRIRNVKPVESGFFYSKDKQKRDNFDMYMPEMKSLGEKLTLNFEMVIRVDTNLKLNMVGRDGKALISPDDFDEEEIHFMRVESVCNEFEISPKTVFRMIKEMFSKKQLNFRDWTITDFDDFLKGNPHVIL